MAMDPNSVSIGGRLTKDPNLRYSQSGVAVCNFTVANNRGKNNQTGEDNANFIQVVTFKKSAENVANYLKKGSRVHVEGELSTRSYDNDAGQRVYVTEVIARLVTFLDPPSGQGQQGDQGQQGGNYGQGQQGGQNHSQGQQGGQNYGQGQQGGQGNNYGNQPQDNGSPFNSQENSLDISDDDIPF